MVKTMATKKATRKKPPAKRKPAAKKRSASTARTEVRDSAFNLPTSVPTQHEGLPLGYEGLVPEQPEN